MRTSIAQAFANAGYAVPKYLVAQSGWSATLSYKTRMSLRNQGMPV